MKNIPDIHPIETERLLLRELVPSDAEAIVNGYGADEEQYSVRT